MKTAATLLLALLIFTTGSLAQAKLPTFNATAIEKEDPEWISDWGLGCSFYCANFSVTKFASSTLPRRRKLKYGAALAHDFDLNTAWVEGEKGDGVGAALEYVVDTSEGTGDVPLVVTSLYIFNGYRKSRELWRDNSRVKKLKMYVDGKPYGIINLQDAYNYQTVEVGSIELKLRGKTTLRFEIMEVYKGRKYSDTAITEIELEGCCAH